MATYPRRAEIRCTARPREERFHRLLMQGMVKFIAASTAHICEIPGATLTRS